MPKIMLEQAVENIYKDAHQLIVDGASWLSIGSGCECYVFYSKDRPNVVLKIYRYRFNFETILAIAQAQEIAYDWGIGPEVLSDIIRFEKNHDTYFGYLSEQVRIFENCSAWEDELKDFNIRKRALSGAMDAVFDINHWDLHHQNMGFTKDGNLVCIDFGLGTSRDQRIRTCKRKEN